MASLGVTGTEAGEGRAALAEMMTVLHANETKLVVVEKLGCLARDLMTKEPTIADLPPASFVFFAFLYVLTKTKKRGI